MTFSGGFNLPKKLKLILSSTKNIAFENSDLGLKTHLVFLSKNYQCCSELVYSVVYEDLAELEYKGLS